MSWFASLDFLSRSVIERAEHPKKKANLEATYNISGATAPNTCTPCAPIFAFWKHLHYAIFPLQSAQVYQRNNATIPLYPPLLARGSVPQVCRIAVNDREKNILLWQISESIIPLVAFFIFYFKGSTWKMCHSYTSKGLVPKLCIIVKLFNNWV